MIICKACGADNDFGLVFCSGCGAKLDLTNVSSDLLASAQTESWVKRYRIWLAAGLLVLLSIPVWLVMWPRTERLGEAGTPVGRMRVIEGFETVKRYAENPQIRAVEVPFTEADINAYFARGKAQEMGFESVTVRIGYGSMHVRVVRQLWDVNVGLFRWVPQVSTDMILVPIGSVLRPRRVSVGRLRLIGPFRRSPIRRLQTQFSAQREWREIGAAASEFRAENGQFIIAVARP